MRMVNVWDHPRALCIHFDPHQSYAILSRHMQSIVSFRVINIYSPQISASSTQVSSQVGPHFHGKIRQRRHKILFQEHGEHTPRHRRRVAPQWAPVSFILFSINAHGFLLLQLTSALRKRRYPFSGFSQKYCYGWQDQSPWVPVENRENFFTGMPVRGRTRQAYKKNVAHLESECTNVVFVVDIARLFSCRRRS